MGAPDLVRLFKDGKHFLGFDHLTSAIQMSLELIRSAELREQIRREAREAVKPHTYDARIQTILEDVGLV